MNKPMSYCIFKATFSYQRCHNLRGTSINDLSIKQIMIKLCDIDIKCFTFHFSIPSPNTVEHSRTRSNGNQIFLFDWIRLCSTGVRLCSTVFDCVRVRLHRSSIYSQWNNILKSSISQLRVLSVKKL